MRKSMFDIDGDGKLDSIEKATEMMFIEEVIEKEESESSPVGSRRSTKSYDKQVSPPKGISFAGKPLYDATKDDVDTVLLKSILVIVFCIGGFALPVILDTGDFGTMLCLFGGVALSMLVLKNT